jgi:hypothetical protein
VITAAEYVKLQELQAKLARQEGAAEGVLQSILDRLQVDFGWASVKEGKTKLKELQKEALAADAAYHEALRGYKQEFGDFLGV